MDKDKDGKISKDEMLQSKLALQYEQGETIKIPTIVEQPPVKKGTAWYGPVIVLLSLAFAAWYIYTAFKQ